MDEFENCKINAPQAIADPPYAEADCPYAEADCPSTTEDEIAITINTREERDSRSIFISNIHATTTHEDIRAHFDPCGTIISLAITNVKGSDFKRNVYLEFESASSVENGILLNNSVLQGRTLRVLRKRTNIRNFHPRTRQEVPASIWQPMPWQYQQQQWIAGYPQVLQPRPPVGMNQQWLASQIQQCNSAEQWYGKSYTKK